MCTLVFAIMAAVCAIGWLSRYVSTLSVIYYMEKKQYPLPTDSELKECTAWVVKHLLKQ